MRVLMVHNAYRSGPPSGENLAVHDEVAVLRAAGWDVDLLETSSDEVVGDDRRLSSRLRASTGAVWNFRAVRTLRNHLERGRPDVVHVQNDFPLLGPAVHRALGEQSVPYVQSIRNYRFACVSASLFRDGASCTLCLGRRMPLDGVRHRCGGGGARSAYVTAWIAANGRVRQAAGPLLIANSHHVAGRLVDAGVPAAKVRWRHNVVPVGPRPPLPREARSGVVVAGRLDPAKGIHDLAHAWAAQPVHGEHLTVLGDGPDTAHVARIAATCPSMTHAGRVPHDEVLARVARARLVIVPSQWEEPFGRIALEALLIGTPALVTPTGGLPEVVAPVDGSFVAPSTDPVAVVEHARWMLSTDRLLPPSQIADLAHRHFGPDAFVRRTEQLYREAIDHDRLHGSA